MLVCLPLAAPIGLSPLHILTLCGSKRVVVVSTEPLDNLSCLTRRIPCEEDIIWIRGGHVMGASRCLWA